jgi:diaminopimelate decarboxylase
MISDLGASAKLCRHLISVMPRVVPHFAVKCYPDPKLMATLAENGAGFDCASSAELRQVLSLGVDASRVVFANPCKRIVDLKNIAAHKVPHTTFDSVNELEKMATHCPAVGVVLRIRADDTTARMPFGVKYGALPSEIPTLLAAALKLGLKVAGVSFHVGSGAGNPMAFHDAIAAARRVRDELCALDGEASSRPFLLDIGGGFSGGFSEGGTPFVSVGEEGAEAEALLASVINAALTTFFEPFEFPGGLNVISEPGRYFAEASAHIVTRVFGKRVRESSSGGSSNDDDSSNNNSSSSSSNNNSERPIAGGGHRRLVLRSAIDPSWRQDPDPASSPSSSSPSEEGEETKDAVRAAARAGASSAGAVVSAPITEKEVHMHYYISDGMYGGFNAIVYDGWLPRAVPFRVNSTGDGSASLVTQSTPPPPQQNKADSLPPTPTNTTTSTTVTKTTTVTTIFGPTCDSLDMVFNGLTDCPPLEVGDWLLFPACGAYTAAGATDFNGIPSNPYTGTGTKAYYVRAESHAVPDNERGSGAPKVLFSPKGPLSVTKNY